MTRQALCYKVAQRRVCVNIVAVEKQLVLNIISVSALFYLFSSLLYCHLWPVW